jgi:formate dehydrogenase iron-sulfur subunit
VGLAPLIGVSAATLGILGVFFSVMVYAATRRAHWRGSLTGFRFFTTTVVLGAATTYAVGAASSGGAFAHRGLLLGLLIASASCKLAFEASLLVHRRNRQHTVEKRMALLLTRELGLLSLFRFTSGLTGGILIPWLLLAAPAGSALVGLPCAMLLLLLGGELAERFSFFAAAPASRMPGGLR